jgi:hypothetical protein
MEELWRSWTVIERESKPKQRQEADRLDKERASALPPLDGARPLGMSGEVPAVPPDAWRETVGMFADDPEADRIFEAGRRYRQSLREPE